MLESVVLAQAAAPGGDISFFIMIALMIGVFYFLLIRPQQKRAKEHRAMVQGVRRGDTVVTAGGLIGKVTRVESGEEVMVEIADGVRVKVVSSTLADVRSKGEPAKTDDAKNDND